MTNIPMFPDLYQPALARDAARVTMWKKTMIIAFGPRKVLIAVSNMNGVKKKAFPVAQPLQP